MVRIDFQLCKEKMAKRYVLFILAPLMVVFMQSNAHALNLNVIGSDGVAVGGYRWLVEEDATYHITPGIMDPNGLSSIFHKSYMPLVAKGDEATPPTNLALDPTKHYFISVLPKVPGSYSISGAPIAPGQDIVTVTVNKLSFPTAQITIFVFEDNYPINNAPDLPGEQGLEGFSILLEDAGGRYGASAGAQLMDAFGNYLGTTYNPDGTVAVMGDGIIKTDENGEAAIKNLAPGKYGIQVVPPAGEGWSQTTTIEGSKVIDAWVMANEPPYLIEFGVFEIPAVHVFVGFVKPINDETVMTGDSTITGRVVNQHIPRVSDFTYGKGFGIGTPMEYTVPWVGLNLLGGVAKGKGVYAQPANADGTFSIPNVPPGSYQLVVWDKALVIIIDFSTVVVPEGGGEVALGDVPVLNWFSRLENYVYNDENENGFRDEGEIGILEQAINIRWRDGTIYQSFLTDLGGFVSFDMVFPFFHWLVAEVDFARFKATGVTVVVDEGGAIDANDPWSFGGLLNPQPQSENGGLHYRTETGPVLTQGFQGFQGQTSVLLWGKKAYGPNENGGISGIVYYAVTRAEDDPRYAAAEPWEPGIPRVTVRLYDSTGTILLNEVTTDSWDDSLPTGCQGKTFVYQGRALDCFDGLRSFNQVRPGVFDGGYLFESYWSPSFGAAGANEVSGLPPGEYVVEVVPPVGYEILKEEDKNVDFGEDYIPKTDLLPPICVGAPHTVPVELDLFPGVPAFFAGQTRPLCDRKQVYLSAGQNAAVDFFLFTEVPVAGHIKGLITDDISNESKIISPNLGEKYAPPWLPISFRDWTGKVITRTYSDEYGAYNLLVPSTYSANLPQPSGMSPNMLRVCLNDPFKPDPNNPGSFVIDPYFNRQYGQACYTFQFMPGTTTYLDTPVIPISAFAGTDSFLLDCEFPDGTPKIHSVSGPMGGPYITAKGQQISILSEGVAVSVPNPAYAGLGSTEPKTITRDYGFGNSGKVTIAGKTLNIVSWSPTNITAEVPEGTRTGQLVVTRNDNGKSTKIGVTVTVATDGLNYNVIHVTGQTIQQAIDFAKPGDLILVPPGTYTEAVVMWKPVRLQGWGAGSVIINALKSPGETLQTWREKVAEVIDTGAVDLLPAQTIGAAGVGMDTPFVEQGPGIIVLAKNVGPEAGGFGLVAKEPNARIDGFTITGGYTSGGIVVNGYAHHLKISNNHVFNNNGLYGGGIRIGNDPFLTLQTENGLVYQDTFNDNINIHHNQINQNGGIGGSGAGVSLCTGSDSYRITENFICGNFSQGEGAGIGHLGLSDGGVIADNAIIFNESFKQGQTASGGGIFIGGGAPLAGRGSLTPGSGSVKIYENLIQGNSASAGDGGGIRTNRVNGQDILTYRTKTGKWYSVDIYNNMIVNNIAALAGGGISLQDTAMSRIYHNTIAFNDSTATASDAFAPGNNNQSTPQPAGLVSHKHSPELTAAITQRIGTNSYKLFSNPELINNIIWHNRSFYFAVDNKTKPSTFGLMPNPDSPVYNDLAVLGTAAPETLNPLYCILSVTTGYDKTNIMRDPKFNAEYVNGDRGKSLFEPTHATNKIQAPVAFDEGGNFIRVVFGPLTLTHPDTGKLYGDYHIQDGSPAVGRGDDLALFYLANDFDGQSRPAGDDVDIGADENSEEAAVQTAGKQRDKKTVNTVTDERTTQVIENEEGRIIKTQETPPRPRLLVQCPGDTDGDAVIDTPDSNHPNAVCMHVGAGDGFITMADGREMYMFSFMDLTGIPVNEAMGAGILAATFPAPSIILDQGDEFYLNLTNVGMMIRPDLFDPHTIHWHGFPEASTIFDGVPNSSVSINMGATFTYYYNVVEPGTYIYHCHVEATEHIQMGMIGNLYVRPAQNKLAPGTDLNGFTHQAGFKYVYNDGDGSTYYDVEYPIQLGNFDPDFHDASETVQPLPFALMKDKYPMINGRGYPDTVNTAPLPAPEKNGGIPSQLMSSLIEATQGQKILLRISNVNVTRFDTLTILGIPMKVVGKDAQLLRGPSPDGGVGNNLYYETNSVTLGGGENYDVLLDTTDIATGTYFLYTTNLHNLSNNTEDFGGMMTEIIIY